jgi:hypothetical protein
MKMIVIHDRTGKIRSAGVPGPEFVGQVHLVAERNQRVAEIETKPVEDFTELTKNFRIDPAGNLLPTKRGTAPRKKRR